MGVWNETSSGSRDRDPTHADQKLVSGRAKQILQSTYPQTGYLWLSSISVEAKEYRGPDDGHRSTVQPSDLGEKVIIALYYKIIHKSTQQVEVSGGSLY